MSYMLFSDKKYPNSNQFLISTVEIIWAFLCTVGLVALAATLLSFHPISELPITSVIVPWGVNAINPKPHEQFVILATLLLVPILNLISLKIIISIPTGFKKVTYFAPSLLVLPLMTIFPFVFYVDKFIPMSYVSFLTPGLSTQSVILCMSLTLIFFVSSALSKQNKNAYFQPSKKFWHAAFMLFGLCIALFLTFSFRIISLPMEQSITYNHVDAIFYSISQVIGGKTLLIDLPAQYGLYAEFLKPLFFITGLSLFKFTVIMGLLQIVALSFLFLTILKIIKNKFIILISIMTLSFMTYYTYHQLHGTFDPYYQYYPIRFLFPAIAIFLFSCLLKNFSFKNVLLLWNFDSGIPVWGAFIGFLIFMLLFPRKNLSRPIALKMLLINITTVAVVFLIFFGYLSLKAHTIVDLSQYLKYQHIFYVTGFAMLPIARGFAHWQIIVGIYLLGLTIPLYSWIKGYHSSRHDMLFYLSILGFGLFSYYTGRSHPLTLALCLWPALIIGCIITDMLLRLIKAKKLPYFFVIPVVPIVLFGVLISASLTQGIPVLYNIGQQRWATTLENKPNQVSHNIAFIKSKVNNEKEAIILTPIEKSLASIYYAETGLTSPVRGPGLIEMLLQDDWENMIQTVMKNCNKPLFIQLDDTKQIPTMYQFSLTAYKIIDKTEDMIYLKAMCSEPPLSS